MTFKITPRNAWAIGYFDPDERSIHYADSTQFFKTPKDVLDYVCSDNGKKLELGPSGLVFIHTHRTARKSVNHYFQSLQSANRFHYSLTNP